MDVERVDDLGIHKWNNVGLLFRRAVLGDMVGLILSTDAPLADSGISVALGIFCIALSFLTRSSASTWRAYQSAQRVWIYRRIYRIPPTALEKGDMVPDCIGRNGIAPQ